MAEDFHPYDSSAEDPVQLIWPRGLRLPQRPPNLIYLDLNHWIRLSQAAIGHHRGAEYRDALWSCRAAVRSGAAIFPLSITHAMEVSANQNRRQRADVARIMEELSRFVTLRSWPTVLRFELETALDDAFGASTGSLVPIDLIGWGFLQALGRDGSLRFTDEAGNDLADQVRDQIGSDAFDRLVESSQLALQRSILSGPQTDAEEGDLRSRGWDPFAARRVAEDRAAAEREQAQILDNEPAWRHGRLRDVLLARHIANELFDSFSIGLSEREVELHPGLFPDRASARRFARSMPTTEVIVSLKTVYHQNPQTRWTINHIFDIDAMAVAVPYCDAVVTDHQIANALEREGIGERTSTAILSRPQELEAWLDT